MDLFRGTLPRRWPSSQSTPDVDSPPTRRLRRGASLYTAALLTLSAAGSHLGGLLAQPPRSGLLIALLLAFAVIQGATALVIVAAPTRRLLVAAAVVEGIAVLLWVVVRATGVPLGSTSWWPETLGVMDFFLPAVEFASAVFILSLVGSAWTAAPRVARTILGLLPVLLGLGLLIAATRNVPVAEVTLVILFFTANIPTSLLDLFLPAVGILVVFVLARIGSTRLRAATPGAGWTALKLVPALLLISLLTWASVSTATDRPWFPDSATVSAPAGRTTTLAYCSPGGDPLAMDLTEPAAGAARPAPAVFYIHGGEGLLGDRVLAGPEAPYLARLRDDLVRRGFVVGSIDYRLAPRYPFVDQVEDAKCAVRFLRANARTLGIDSRRIGVYGDSEGGYLAAMLGVMGSTAGFDVGQYLDQSSRVQAVVDMWGPSDLTDFSGSPSWVSAMGQGIAGGTTSIERGRAASPLYHVAPGDPPFLIIHGTDDWFIAPHHSQNLAQRLRAAAVPATLVMVQHGGHGLDSPTAGQIQQPGPDAIVEMIDDFFARTLGS